MPVKRLRALDEEGDSKKNTHAPVRPTVPASKKSPMNGPAAAPRVVKDGLGRRCLRPRALRELLRDARVRVARSSALPDAGRGRVAAFDYLSPMAYEKRDLSPV
jgi:hypothetical protein